MTNNPPAPDRPSLREIVIEALDHYHEDGEWHDYTPLEKERHANNLLSTITDYLTGAAPEKWILRQEDWHKYDTAYQEHDKAIDEYTANLKRMIEEK